MKAAAQHADAATDGDHPPTIEDAAQSDGEFVNHG
jgi:hypothetical protein